MPPAGSATARTQNQTGRPPCALLSHPGCKASFELLLVSSSCAVAQVLAANGVETFIQLNDGFTPTPVISRAILVHNRGRSDSLADGIVNTPSHNPPADGGLKYNPPNGGPADTDVTDWIQNRANELLCAGNGGVQRIGF